MSRKETPRRTPTQEAALLAGLEPIDEPSTELMATGNARRGRRSRGLDERSVVVTLLRDDHYMYRWHLGDLSLATSRRRGRRRRAGVSDIGIDSEIAEQYRFVREGENQITATLIDKDGSLTPRQGLRQIERHAKSMHPGHGPAEEAGDWVRHPGANHGASPGAWWRIGRETSVAAAGPSLVLVHGTFSKGDMYLSELVETPEGARFLEDAWGRYEGRVYAFNHATLSVGPLVNAVALARALPVPARSTPPVDFVAHSRGGLVTRWAIDVLRPDVRARAVLVGAPLGGTSLASPARARAALNALTTFGKALERDGSLFATPFLAVPNLLVKTMTAVTGILSRLPIFDAGIALVPGLHSMSSVTTNREIDELLRTAPPPKGRYYVIGSNFEPEAVGWKFWRLLRPAIAKQKVADWGADVLFPGENDLVVDSTSMGGFVPGDQIGETLMPRTVRWFKFTADDHVHHCAYFRHARTLEAIREHLGM